MPIPEEARKLIRHFDEQREAYHAGQYREAELRKEFLDPFFEALGWDMSNKQGLSETHKEVIHEYAIREGGTTRSPDYCFRIGGTRKFFVEAKKPAVKVKEDISAAYQLRSYAWTVKLPLSILTDFEEFAIYDCRGRPDQADKPTTARIRYLLYTDYPQRWDDIADIFSREAVLQGSLDRYVDSIPSKKGTVEVDEAFLQEIESWRKNLAQNLALRNPGLTTRQLNFAVQSTIDRIIFLRICEGRGIEPDEQLRELQSGERVYAHLCQLFQQADDRYNSGLFHFRPEKGRTETPDELSLNLSLDDKLLKEIIQSLYPPKSPYKFSILPVEILGQVYEQFLGKVIRLTPGHRAEVEDKPEVRKAGGVYYTPTYIVEYIVKNTVGRLLDGKTPRQVASLRILDPACGSGSFLIGAYQYLLDWHRDWYVADDPQKWRTGKSPALYQALGGDWRLTTAERKRILLNNIYGVDIDPQAVEVTKLSLLLKVLEGENEQTLATQLRLFHERALPDLGNNVKCGNSLISPDFYEGQQTFLDEEERYHLNVFDWPAEFPEVMAAGGFDAVIGNPPYIFGEYHNQNAKRYFHSEFALARKQYDTYGLFIEKGLQLTANNGRFAMIVPDALLARDEAQDVRAMLLSQGLERVYHCGLVFQASVSAAVFTVAKGYQHTQLFSEVREGTSAVLEHTCTRDRFVSDSRHRLLVHASDQEAQLLHRVQTGCKTLAEFVSISRGEETGKRGVLHEGPIPILVGEDISRWHIRQPSSFVQEINKDTTLYNSLKIVIVKTGSQCIAALDTEGLVTMQSVYNVHVSDPVLSPKAILGVLNSRFVRFVLHKTFTAYKLLFPQLNQSTVQSIPIPVDIGDRQAPLVSLVEQMLALHKQLAAAKTPDAKTFLQRQIEATDKQIDRLVYDLYGLTAEDISIVEGLK